MVESWIVLRSRVDGLLFMGRTGWFSGRIVDLRSRVVGLLFMGRTGWFSGRIVDCFTQ